MRDNPERWGGFPGCATANGRGWQLCPALGFGQLMAMLPNSTGGGLQWSSKWKQPYFIVPPGVYPDPKTDHTGTSAAIWIENAKSLAPKYVLL